MSLSNTLFRRDAGAFAAYLVDAETGELHDPQQRTAGARPGDRPGQHRRRADGPRGRRVPRGEAPTRSGVGAIIDRYRDLWYALTETERFETGDRWRVEERIRRLNELGFDIDELAMSTDLDGTTIQIQPKVVDAGHHSRRLLRLTGLDVEENQARRLLNDLDAYRAATDRQDEDEELVAHDWLTRSTSRSSAPCRASCRQARAGRALPRGPRAPLVPLERAGHDSRSTTRSRTTSDGAAQQAGREAVLGVDTVEMPVIVWDD